MKLKLTASEHRVIGPVLVILTRSVQSADVLNKFKRNGDILKRLRRAARQLEKLRCKLDSLMAEQHPAEFQPSVYYGARDKDVHWPLDALEGRLETEVGKVINGKAPAALLDLYLLCELALHVLKVGIEDQRERDQQRLRHYVYP